MKNMEAGSPSNGPFPTSCPPDPKIEFSQKEIVNFTIGTVRRFFSGFWRLLGRLKNEKMKKRKNEKKNEKGKKLEKKKKHEKNARKMKK